MHHLESVFSCVVFGLIFVSSSYVFCHSRFTPGDFFHMMDRAHEEFLYPQVIVIEMHLKDLVSQLHPLLHEQSS